MTPLTPKQKRFLDFVVEHTEREGYSPSQAEIARALGFRSLGTVQNYLTRLEREGLIEKDLNARRGIRVRLPEGYGYQLPLAGLVSAGRPIEAIETTDTIPVVALMGNEATVKRFYRKIDRIELHPANAAMEPIIVEASEEFSILGVVVGVIRYLK
jgi:repressor LexA